MRPYRDRLRTGQTSPLDLGNFALAKITELYTRLNRPVRVLDIGCGSGMMMRNIRDRAPSNSIEFITGLDWSVPAVERLQGDTLYSEVVLCQSSRLPFSDKKFDIAVSIENLEHLYKDNVVPAIQEMARVADHIVIVTPTKKTVINRNWLVSEIQEADTDIDPISDSEFCMLEGAVHKSVVTISSMELAGFEVGDQSHGRFYAPSTAINFDIIEVIGIDPDNSSTTTKEKYCKLLSASLELDLQMNQGL